MGAGEAAVPERPGFYPSAMLPDRDWYLVTKILRAHGTKGAESLADRIDKSLVSPRRRHDERVAALR